MGTSLDVVGIGNALVDVLSHQDDAFIQQIGVAKGAMTLIDRERSAELYGLVGERITISGGSAANTVIGVGSLGGVSGYVGRVAADDLGDVFAADMAELGIEYTTPRAPHDDPTGRCIVFITPDGERTMNTFLGASNGLTPTDVDMDLVQRGRIVFLEGYLWDPPEAKTAMREAAAGVPDGNQVALTLSDPFCVERHRQSFIDLIDDHVDVLFANHHELLSLFETDDLDRAVEMIRGRVGLAAVTRSEAGSLLVTADDTIRIAPEPVAAVVDATGAGDLYASGVLFGLARGLDLETCGRLGSVAAAEVISHVGPRPEVPLAELVAHLI
jgi:sugar/nucleoside kinase (ribokinase family)